MTIEEIRQLPAVIPLWPDAGQALGYSRPRTYELVQRGEFDVPVMKKGSRYRVLLSDVLRALRIDEADQDGARLA
jgi:predicted DNA-binding transcriptional regulator AlpA